MASLKRQVIIIGGGSAGIAVAVRLKALGVQDIAIIDPAQHHYYQPAFTLVGGGVYRLEDTRCAMRDLIPDGVEWICDAVESLKPESNMLTLKSQSTVTYDYLVVAPGIKLDWDKVAGLKETLGTNSVCSNYSEKHVEYTWQAIREFSGGTALFTFPNTPVKCAGAPQKIMYLAEHYWRRRKMRDQCKIMFVSAAGAIFGVKKYAEALEGVVKRRGIETTFKRNLVAINADEKVATFKHNETGEESKVAFDFIHVTPPMAAPDFVRESPLANPAGWVDVDKHTLQHVRFKNVFSLGDASSLPTSKTGAAIRKQAPIVAAHMVALKNGQTLNLNYNGYTSCPLVTGYGKLILAEFDYDGKPQETFPFDQSKERLSMYLLKKHVLPKMYWQGMMKGRL